MLRIALAAVLLLCLLPVCGRPVELGYDDIIINPAVQILLNEPTSTNGVSWRAVDLTYRDNAQLRAWIEENEGRWRGEVPAEPEPQSRALLRAFQAWLAAQGDNAFAIPSQSVYPLGDRQFIVARSDHPTFGISEIFLRDETTGEETLLLDSNSGLWRPWVMEIIDERFFMYTFSLGDVGVFDLQRMMKIPVDLSSLFLLHYHDGVHYFIRRPPDSKRLEAYTLTLGDFDLNTAATLQVSNDLLETIPQASTDGWDYWGWAELSPDGRYLAAEEWTNAVHIFDLHTRQFVARVPAAFRTAEMTLSCDGFWKDAHTLICLNLSHRNAALEITLP